MTLIDQLNHIDLAITQYEEKLQHARRKMDYWLPYSQAYYDAQARVFHYENEIENLERAYTGVALGEIEL